MGLWYRGVENFRPQLLDFSFNGPHVKMANAES
jgi:hypothetical protein